VWQSGHMSARGRIHHALRTLLQDGRASRAEGASRAGGGADGQHWAVYGAASTLR
ncbi:unnamed protein product, partial [Closterium sp. NIES-53]